LLENTRTPLHGAFTALGDLGGIAFEQNWAQVLAILKLRKSLTSHPDRVISGGWVIRQGAVRRLLPPVSKVVVMPDWLFWVAGLIAVLVAVWLGWRAAAHQRRRRAPWPPGDDIQFTVYRPRAVTPDRWYDLLAFAHLAAKLPEAPSTDPDPVAEVARQATQVLGVGGVVLIRDSVSPERVVELVSPAGAAGEPED
jgi:hypothetical protein